MIKVLTIFETNLKMNSQTFQRMPQLLTLFLWTFFLSCPGPAVYKNGDMIWIYDILIEINKAALKSELNHLFGNGHGREVSGSVQNYSISSNYSGTQFHTNAEA